MSRRSVDGALLIFGTQQDITETRLAELETGEARDELRRIFERAPVAKAVIDANGFIVDVNHAFAILLARRKRNLVGTRWEELVQAGDRARVAAELARAVEDNASTQVDEVRLAIAGGDDAHMSIMAAPLSAAGGLLVELDAHTARLSDTPVWSTDASVDVSTGPDADGSELTLGEAASVLRVSTSTLRRWADAGKIEAMRTSGGHRRFRSSDVSLLQDEDRGRPMLRRPPLPPSSEGSARTLEEHGNQIVRLAAETIYDDGSLGWFRTDEGMRSGRVWVAVLVGSFRSGVFADALLASRAHLRRARLGGASLLECDLAIKGFDDILCRLVRTGRAAKGDTTPIRMLLVAIRHEFLSQ
jgi:excisionase family DNA binding protein/PAS domain S-box-containing protein